MATPFPKELRKEVTALALTRTIPFTQLARDYGVSSATIHQWVQAIEGKPVKSKPADDDRSAELKDAQKQIRKLEQEVEILKRAAAFFSRDVLPK